MKYDEAKPKHNEYWWVLDEDGTRTVVWIEHDKNDSIVAQYPGNPDSYDATTLNYVGRAVTFIPTVQKPKPFDFSDLEQEYGKEFVALGKEVARDLSQKEINDITIHTGKVGDIKLVGTDILNTVTKHELDREKIELADALISLLPGDYSKMQRIKMLEDAIGYTPKHVLHRDTLNDVDTQTEQQKEENT